MSPDCDYQRTLEAAILMDPYIYTTSGSMRLPVQPSNLSSSQGTRAKQPIQRRRSHRDLVPAWDTTPPKSLQKQVRKSRSAPNGINTSGIPSISEEIVKAPRSPIRKTSSKWFTSPLKTFKKIIGADQPSALAPGMRKECLRTLESLGKVTERDTTNEQLHAPHQQAPPHMMKRAQAATVRITPAQFTPAQILPVELDADGEVTPPRDPKEQTVVPAAAPPRELVASASLPRKMDPSRAIPLRPRQSRPSSSPRGSRDPFNDPEALPLQPVSLVSPFQQHLDAAKAKVGIKPRRHDRHLDHHRRNRRYGSSSSSSSSSSSCADSTTKPGATKRPRRHQHQQHHDTSANPVRDLATALSTLRDREAAYREAAASHPTACALNMTQNRCKREGVAKWEVSWMQKQSRRDWQRQEKDAEHKLSKASQSLEKARMKVKCARERLGLPRTEARGESALRWEVRGGE